MDMSNPFSFRSGSVDPLALMPAGPRKPAPSGSPAHFERHLDNGPRADGTRRAERERGRDEDDRASARSESKRADAARDKNDPAMRSTAEENGDAADLTLDPILLAAEQPAAEGETILAPKEEEGLVSLAPDENPEQAAKPAGMLPQDETALPDAAPEEIAAAAQTSSAESARADAKSGENQHAVQNSNASPPHDMREKAKAGQAQKTTPATAAGAGTEADLPPEAQAAKPVTRQQQADAQSPLAASPEKPVEDKLSMGLGHEAAAKMARSKAEGKAAAKPDTKMGAADKAGDVRAFAPQAAPNAAPAAGPSAASSAMPAATEGGVDGQTSSLPQPLSQQQNNSAPTIRFGTLPGHAAPTQVPSGAIALQMARNLQKGISRFDIRLDPAELGRIDVRMEVQKDGRVAAHLMVERPETLDLLQRDASALTRALNDAGLQTSSDSLNFSLRDQNAGNGSPFFSDAAPGHADAAPEAAEESMTPVYNVNLSATGGVDIRV